MAHLQETVECDGAHAPGLVPSRPPGRMNRSQGNDMFRWNRAEVGFAWIAVVGLAIVVFGAVGLVSGAVHFVLGHDRFASAVLVLLGAGIAIRGVTLHRRAAREKLRRREVQR